jgi:hypothetical protein
VVELTIEDGGVKTGRPVAVADRQREMIEAPDAHLRSRLALKLYSHDVLRLVMGDITLHASGDQIDERSHMYTATWG